VWCRTPDEYTTSNDPEPLRRRRCHLQRFAREIGTDDDSTRPRQIQAHLPCATPDLDNSRVEGDRTIEETRKLAATGSRPQPDERVVWRVSRKRRLVIETSHDFDARFTGQPKIGDAIERGITRSATLARPVRRQLGPAAGARRELAELLFHH